MSHLRPSTFDWVDNLDTCVFTGDEFMSLEANIEFARYLYSWQTELRLQRATKVVSCDGCGIPTIVHASYEPEGCCSGHECGCRGKVTKPVFCLKCDDKFHKY